MQKLKSHFSVWFSHGLDQFMISQAYMDAMDGCMIHSVNM